MEFHIIALNCGNYAGQVAGGREKKNIQDRSNVYLHFLTAKLR